MSAINQVDVVSHYLQGDGIIPNSALPLLVYPGVISLPENDPAHCRPRFWPTRPVNGLVAKIK